MGCCSSLLGWPWVDRCVSSIWAGFSSVACFLVLGGSVFGGDMRGVTGSEMRQHGSRGTHLGLRAHNGRITRCHRLEHAVSAWRNSPRIDHASRRGTTLHELKHHLSAWHTPPRVETCCFGPARPSMSSIMPLDAAHDSTARNMFISLAWFFTIQAPLSVRLNTPRIWMQSPNRAKFPHAQTGSTLAALRLERVCPSLDSHLPRQRRTFIATPTCFTSTAFLFCFSCLDLLTLASRMSVTSPAPSRPGSRDSRCWLGPSRVLPAISSRR